MCERVCKGICKCVPVCVSGYVSECVSKGVRECVPVCVSRYVSECVTKGVCECELICVSECVHRYTRGWKNCQWADSAMWTLGDGFSFRKHSPLVSLPFLSFGWI